MPTKSLSEGLSVPSTLLTMLLTVVPFVTDFSIVPNKLDCAKLFPNDRHRKPASTAIFFFIMFVFN